ncbi:MAG: hypothetical protein OHK0012_05130 [Synechococcales cyanobacterium]
MTHHRRLRRVFTVSSFVSRQHHLMLALKAVNQPHIPPMLTMTSYLRIACAILRHDAGTSAKARRAGLTYWTLLERLQHYQSNWWDYCALADNGYVQTRDPVIASILAPLNDHFFPSPQAVAV